MKSRSCKTQNLWYCGTFRSRPVLFGWKKAIYATGSALKALLWVCVPLLILKGYGLTLRPWFLFAVALTVYTGEFLFSLRRWGQPWRYE